MQQNSVLLKDYNQHDENLSQLASPDTIEHSYNTMAMQNDGNMRDSVLSNRRRKKNKRNQSIMDSMVSLDGAGSKSFCCGPSKVRSSDKEDNKDPNKGKCYIF
jgi:hypothetical protein